MQGEKKRSGSPGTPCKALTCIMHLQTRSITCADYSTIRHAGWKEEVGLAGDGGPAAKEAP